MLDVHNHVVAALTQALHEVRTTWRMLAIATKMVHARA